MICGRKSSRLWPPSLPPWCCGGFPLPLGFCGPGPHLYLWLVVFQDPTPSSGCWCQVPTPFHCWWVFKPPPLLPIGVKWVSSRPAVVGEGGGRRSGSGPTPSLVDTWIRPRLFSSEGHVDQSAPPQRWNSGAGRTVGSGWPSLLALTCAVGHRINLLFFDGYCLVGGLSMGFPRLVSLRLFCSIIFRL